MSPKTNGYKYGKKSWKKYLGKLPGKAVVKQLKHAKALSSTNCKRTCLSGWLSMVSSFFYLFINIKSLSKNAFPP